MLATATEFCGFCRGRPRDTAEKFAGDWVVADAVRHYQTFPSERYGALLGEYLSIGITPAPTGIGSSCSAGRKQASPSHVVASKPGTNSPIVGTSGSTSERVVSV